MFLSKIIRKWFLLSILGLCVQPLQVTAQETPPTPLRYDHWAYEFLEALQVLGLMPGWTSDIRPVPQSTLSQALAGIRTETDGATRQTVSAWTDHFDRSIGASDDSESRVQGQLLLSGGIRDGDNFLNPGSGSFIDISGSLSLSSWFAVWGHADLDSQEEFAGFRGGGAAASVGPFSLMVARQPLRSPSPALESALLSGEVPLDAIYLVTRRPVSVPGLSWALGKIRWQFAFGPWSGIDRIDEGWTILGAAVTQPHPRLQLGFSRVIRFSGQNTPGVTVERLFKTAAFVHNSPNDWDDQTVQIHARVQWQLGDHPISSYLVFPIEDPLNSLWRDPGLQIGLTTPIQSERGLFYFRYQYSAYGRRARWCPGCAFANGDEGDPASAEWFRHRRFPAFELEGIPLGDPLGGYGASHDIRVSFWSVNGHFRATAHSFFQVREDENLLAGRWPGKRRGLRLETGWEFHPGLEGSIGTLLTQGPQIDNEVGFTVRLTKTIH